MGRQGGQGKGKPKLKDRGFGRSLINQLNESNKMKKESTKLNSILDGSHLDDYITTLQMDEAAVEVVKVHDQHAYLAEPTVSKFQSMNYNQYQHEQLKIPRKPVWSMDMTAEEIDRSEKNAFLKWRRELSILENSEVSRKVTPYEKNLDVWRQLWRTLERSDFAIQIVDARNPLFYYTKDLIVFAAELKPPKKVFLLINKADFLTTYQRDQWVNYFVKEGIPFIFYSAHYEQEAIDKAHHTGSSPSADDESANESEINLLCQGIISSWANVHSRPTSYEAKYSDNITSSEIRRKSEDMNKVDNVNVEESDDETGTHSSYEDFDEDLGSDQGDEDTADTEENNTISCRSRSPEIHNDREMGYFPSASITEGHSTRSNLSKILSRRELLTFLDILAMKLRIIPQNRHSGRICVGMVGYPNVGKSSVINTILGVSKSSHGTVRVGISATPGKTKHFQTINVNERLMICDCPGLVFPSFMASTGEMLCSGVLPINQMRDHIEPATVIATRVPAPLLDAAYGIHIKKILDFADDPNRPPTASEVLSAYCEVKGYITSGTGRWDEFRACKEILRDFNDGYILYCCPPPNFSNMDRWLFDIERLMSKKERIANRLAVQKLSSEPIEKLHGIDQNIGEGEILADTISEMDSNTNPGESKREHKRLKNWGKKGKKLRDKNPYSEENGAVSYVAYSTNRALSAPNDRRNKSTGILSGTPFFRQTLPYQVSGNQAR